MEVDVLSPRSAIRTVSNYESRKRARSPSSSSSTERSSVSASFHSLRRVSKQIANYAAYVFDHRNGK